MAITESQNIPPKLAVPLWQPENGPDAWLSHCGGPANVGYCTELTKPVTKLYLSVQFSNFQVISWIFALSQRKDNLKPNFLNPLDCLTVTAREPEYGEIRPSPRVQISVSTPSPDVFISSHLLHKCPGEKKTVSSGSNWLLENIALKSTPICIL